MTRWILLFLFAATPLRAEVRVFAAASLTDALQEIARGYTAEKIVFNFGSSSTLARQIEEGAPADLFLSADEAKMNRLQARGLIDTRTRVSVLSNHLVVIGNLRTARSIAIAEPATVPAGIYAKQWLESVGMWNPRKIIPTENVRGALAAVEAGNVDAAIVYKTDAMISRRVKVSHEVKNGPRISYPFAVTAEAENPEGARRFLAFLRSPAALATFARFGFVILPSSRSAAVPAAAAGRPARRPSRDRARRPITAGETPALHE